MARLPIKRCTLNRLQNIVITDGHVYLETYLGDYGGYSRVIADDLYLFFKQMFTTKWDDPKP